MASRGHRFLVMCTVATFLWTGVLMEVAHHDLVSGASGSIAVLTSHDCGSHEIHIPADRIHPCLACALSGQRASTPPSIALPTVSCQEVLPAAERQSGHVSSYSYLSSGKRGPPCS